MSDNIRCVSWDFDLVDWTISGCTTEVDQNGTVTCSCNHLTNFAALVVSTIKIIKMYTLVIILSSHGACFTGYLSEAGWL